MKVAALLAALALPRLLLTERRHEEDKLLAGESSKHAGGYLSDGKMQKHHDDRGGRRHLREQEDAAAARLLDAPAPAADDRQPQPLPTHCTHGVLNLSGHYYVMDDIKFADDCNITSEGPAVVELHGRLQFLGEVHFLGNVSFREAKEASKNSCIKVSKSATVHPGAAVAVDGCNSDNAGGALLVFGDLRLRGGSLALRNCSASGSGYRSWGGAVCLTGAYDQTGGSFLASGTSAGGNGGALYAGSFNMTGGTFRVQDAVAGGSGGALYVARDASVSGGQLLLANITAKRQGGGVQAGQDMAIDGANIRIIKAAATDGGGIFVGANLNVSASSQLLMEDCAADDGGGIRAGGHVQLAGRVPFRCTAIKIGAAISATGKIDATNASLEIHTKDDAMVLFSGNDSVLLNDLDCLNSPGCKVSGVTEEVRNLTCPRGQGFRKRADGLACAACRPKHARLAAEAVCRPCPSLARTVCEPDEFGVPPGTMVDLPGSLDNLTRWYYCPSKEVCPGGHLKAAKQPSEKPSFLEDMCVKGHQGPGCVHCSAAFARPDGNMMRCVECANTTQQAALYVATQMLTDIALFASAAATVAGAKSSRPISSTYLNLLMAFAAVAGLVMSAVMQTGGFAHLQATAKVGLAALKVPVALFQGGASSPVMSGECLLQFFGLPKEPYLVHAMTSILPVLLCAILGLWKGFWLALIVTTNVFLPRFVAAFGKYLVTFRVRPEGMAGGELKFDFLPSALGSQHVAVAIIVSAIFFCFLVGVGSWTYVVRSRKKPLEPHVAYLICAYKPEYCFWEVERLVRKMLLALITAMIPVTVSPAVQMLMVSLVLSSSQLLFLAYQPYEVAFWNQTELRLLLAALVMIGLTSCLIANDLHWAQSNVTQQVLIFLICGMAAGISSAMMLLGGRAFYMERFEEKESAKKMIRSATF